MRKLGLHIYKSIWISINAVIVFNCTLPCDLHDGIMKYALHLYSPFYYIRFSYKMQFWSFREKILLSRYCLIKDILNRLTQGTVASTLATQKRDRIKQGRPQPASTHPGCCFASGYFDFHFRSLSPW
jgi:hypothetical protein